MMRPSCGTCHECGHVLAAGRDVGLAGGDGEAGEWCPDCGVLYRYLGHGYTRATRQTCAWAKSRRSSRCGITPRRVCDRCLFPEVAVDDAATPTLLPAYQAGLNFGEEADL